MSEKIWTWYLAEEESEVFDKELESLEDCFLDFSKSKGLSVPGVKQKVFVYNVVCSREVADELTKKVNGIYVWTR